MNPIEAAKQYLIDCGWDGPQAENLLRCLKAETPEALWEAAPKWIEHAGEARSYMNLLETIAEGLVEVSPGDGEWLFSLSDAGVTAGLNMGLPPFEREAKAPRTDLFRPAPDVAQSIPAGYRLQPLAEFDAYQHVNAMADHAQKLAEALREVLKHGWFPCGVYMTAETYEAARAALAAYEEVGR